MMVQNEQDIYKPSWVNRFSFWIDQLPGGNSWYYFGIGLFLFIIQTGVIWIEGAVPVGTFLPEHIFLSAATSFILAIIPYFDKRAMAAFQVILPVSSLDTDEAQEVQSRLTTLPAWTSVLVSLATLGFVFITEAIGASPYQLAVLVEFPVSARILRIVYLFCWWCFGTFIYHTIHQLTLINQIYTKHTRINFFRMKPLYGFSNLAATSAGSLVILPYGFLLVNPDVKLSEPIVLGMYLVITMIGVITFLLPQIGIHQIQQKERDRLLDEVYQCYGAVRESLHKGVDNCDYEGISSISTAFGLLESEISTIKGISTWPWQPETFRWFLTALVLPLLMWLGQYFLGKLLG